MSACRWRGTNRTGDKAMLIATQEDFPLQPRPLCPDCGANHATSHNAEWVCGECGRKWRKEYNPRKADNPPCFYCGGHTIKQTPNYVCTECGRSKRVHLVTA